MNDISISQSPPGGTGPAKQPHVVAGPLDVDLDKVVDHHVPVKYRGNEADRKDMLVHGKQQELRRNFKYVQTQEYTSMKAPCADLPFKVCDNDWILKCWSLRSCDLPVSY